MSFSIIDSIPSELTGILKENKCVQIFVSLCFHYLRLAAGWAIQSYEAPIQQGFLCYQCSGFSSLKLFIFLFS